MAQQAYNPPVRNLSGTAAPASGDCNASGEVGAYYIQTGDTDTVPTEVYLCAQTATTFAWQPVSHYAQDAAPATCNVGTLWFDTNATAGSNLFGCTAANTWTLLGGGAGAGDAAAAVTTTCSGASATFTATSNTLNKFQCTLVATNVTSSTLASLTTGQGFSITVTQPAGGGITFATPTGITGWGGIGTAANEECTQFFVADSATTAHQASAMTCTGGSQSVVIPGSTSGESTIVAPATGGGTSTLPAGTDTIVGRASTDTLTNKTLTSPTINGGATDLGAGTLEVPNSNTLPGTCTVGQSYMKTDATTGQRWYLCESTNTWVAQGGGGTSTCYAVYQPGNADCLYFNESFRTVISASRFGDAASWNAVGANCGNILSSNGFSLAMASNIGISATGSDGICYAIADGLGVLGDQLSCYSFGTGSPLDTWKVQIHFAVTFTATTSKAQIGCTSDASAFSAGNSVYISYSSAAETCSSGSHSTTNWMLVVVTAGTDTCVDLGVAAPTSGNSGEFLAEIESTTPGELTGRIRTWAGAFGSDGTATTNVPTANLFPAMLVYRGGANYTHIFGSRFYVAAEY